MLRRPVVLCALFFSGSVAAQAVDGTWQLTTTCTYYGGPKLLTLWERADGSVTGAVSDDPQTDFKKTEWVAGSRSGSRVWIKLHPMGWVSELELTGELSGARVEGGLHHYGPDDCRFVMMRTDGPPPAAMTPSAGARQATDLGRIAWSLRPKDTGKPVGTVLSAECPGQGSAGALWGTDVYTDDSSLCTAAVHAGLITLANGGRVIFELLPGQASYLGTPRNGLASAGYGAWGGSFSFLSTPSGPAARYLQLGFPAPNLAVVRWSGTPGSAHDWIAVVRADAAESEWGHWTYLDGKTSGEYSPGWLPPGDYQARLYFDWPAGGYVVRDRISFTIGGAATGTPPPPPPPGGTQEAPLPPPPLLTSEGVAPRHGFVKGELSVFLGSDRLSVKRSRVGVSLGADRFHTTWYLLLEPQLDLRLLDARLALGVGAPLRFAVYDFQNDTATGRPRGFGGFQLRKEDWDTVHDYGRLLKYVVFGRKEDNFYVNVGQRYASTVGHGAMVRRYAPNIDIDYPRVSAEIDWYNDYAGFELLTNDLLEWNLIGGIAFIKPLSFFGPQSLPAKTFSVGLSAAVDRTAPDLGVINADGSRALQSDVRIGVSTAPVAVLGIDAEVKLLKTDFADIKPYVDGSFIAGGQGGLTGGVLGRFNLGTQLVNAIRVVVELRWLGDHYVPGYFDTFYEIDRYKVLDPNRPAPAVNGQGTTLYRTKRRDVLETGFGNRGGLYLEASWGIPNRIGFTLAFETAFNSAGKNLVAHFELPWLNFLQFFVSYYKRGWVDFGDLFIPDQGSVFFAGARLRVLPFLFVNARGYKTFRVNPDSVRYESQWGFSVDVEGGWEFGQSRVEAEEGAGE